MAFDRVLAALSQKIQDTRTRALNMVARAVVKTIDDSKKMQSLQLGLLTDETRDDLERFQNYGFTSVPKEGAEAVVAFVGGSRDHGLVIAVDDRRYRIKNLESGEVAVYDATGSTIVLKKNGDIEVTPSSGKLKITADVTLTGKLDVSAKATFAADVAVSGKADVTGDVNSSGTVTGTTDVVGGGKHLKTHVHAMQTPSGLSVSTTGTATAQTGFATGNTAAPT